MWELIWKSKKMRWRDARKKKSKKGEEEKGNIQTNTQMSEQRSIASSTSDRFLIIIIGDVMPIFNFHVASSQAKINNKNYILCLSGTNKEIIGLDIPVNQGFQVQIFNPSQLFNVMDF